MPTTPTLEPLTATIADTTARTGLSRATLYRLVNGNLNLTHLCAESATWN